MSRFKELRTQKGYSQRDLAELLGVNQTAISQWERGVTFPSSSMLLKLCDLYGVTADYILSRSDVPTTQDNFNVDVFGRGTGKETLHLSPKQYAKLKKLLDAGLLDDDEDL